MELRANRAEGRRSYGCTTGLCRRGLLTVIELRANRAEGRRSYGWTALYYGVDDPVILRQGDSLQMDEQPRNANSTPPEPAPEGEAIAHPGGGERRSIVETLIRRIFISQVVILVAFLVFVLVGVFFPDRLGAFALAFLCGAIGGSLSLLKRIRIETIVILKEIESSLVTTLMPLLYGGILAAITYMLFLGCMLTGDGEGGLFTSNLFPEFAGLNCQGGSGTAASGQDLDMKSVIQIKPRSIQDFAKLLVWSLLAGYSEKFVDGILRTLERQSPR